MSISTTTELKTALESWLHRSDLSTRLDDFIALFEARTNRMLRVRAMEAAMDSIALTDGAAALPAGFLAFKELRYDGYPSYTLAPAALEWMRNQPVTSDRPSAFAVDDTQVLCNGSGSVKGTYYQSIPSLTGNATNWLLAAHPDLYLFGCLEEAGFYTRDDATPLWGQRAQALLNQIQSADTGNAINGGPLTARAR